VNPITILSAGGTPPTCAPGSTKLEACASGGGSITYEFFKGTTSLGTDTHSSGGCGSITVPFTTLGSGSHTIKVVATNLAGCAAEKTFPVTVPEELKADLSLAGDSSCDGKLTFTAVVTGGVSPLSIVFSVDGVAKQTGNTVTFSYGPELDGKCHKISVKVTDKNGCTSTPTAPDKDVIGVTQCVKTDKC
jgi:hypothetical protein